MPFESIKSITQLKFKHSAFVCSKDFLLLKGNCKYPINLLFLRFVFNWAFSYKIVLFFTNLELLYNFNLKANVKFKVKLSKFVYVNNCKESYGFKAVKFFQVLSPPIFRLSRHNSKLQKVLLFLSVMLNSK